jgi:hypothetical protein
MGKRKLDKSIAVDSVSKKEATKLQKERARVHAIREGWINPTEAGVVKEYDDQVQRNTEMYYSIENGWLDVKNETDKKIKQVNHSDNRESVLINYSNNKSSGKKVFNNKVVSSKNIQTHNIDDISKLLKKKKKNILFNKDNNSNNDDVNSIDDKLKNSLIIDNKKSSIIANVENTKQGNNYLLTIFLSICIAIILNIFVNSHKISKSVYDDLIESQNKFMERYDNEHQMFNEYKINHENDMEELIKKFNIEKDIEMNNLYNDKNSYLKEIDILTTSYITVQNLLNESDTNHKEFVNLMFKLYGHGNNKELDAEKEFENIRKKSNKEKNDSNKANIESEKADIDVKKEEEDLKIAEENLKKAEEIYNKEKEESELANESYQKATKESVRENKETKVSKESLKTKMDKKRKELHELQLEEERIATEERLKMEKIAQQEKEEEERAYKEKILAEELLKKEREELKKAREEKKRKKKIADQEARESREAEEKEQELKEENLKKGFFFQKIIDESDTFNNVRKLWAYFISDYDIIDDDTPFEIKCLFTSVDDARSQLRNNKDFINIKRRCKNKKVHKNDKKSYRDLSKVFHPDKMKKINCPEEYGTQTQILINTICD